MELGNDRLEDARGAPAQALDDVVQPSIGLRVRCRHLRPILLHEEGLSQHGLERVSTHRAQHARCNHKLRLVPAADTPDWRDNVRGGGAQPPRQLEVEAAMLDVAKDDRQGEEGGIRHRVERELPRVCRRLDREDVDEVCDENDDREQALGEQHLADDPLGRRGGSNGSHMVRPKKDEGYQAARQKQEQREARSTFVEREHGG